MIKKKLFVCLFALCFLYGPACVWAGANDTVATYLESVRKDVEDANPAKTSIGEAKQKYARAKQNMNALGEALANMKREFEGKIEQDPDFQPDAITLTSPSLEALTQLERQRHSLIEELKNLAGQYQDLSSAMARNDMNFINNVGKMTIKSLKDVGAPDVRDLDMSDKVEDAQDMKKFVDGYQETKERTKKTHEEIERIKAQIGLIDQHIGEVSQIEKQFEGIKKGNPWVDGGFDELRRQVREAREKDKAIKDKSSGHQQSVQGKVNSVTAPQPVPKDTDPGPLRDALWGVTRRCEERFNALNDSFNGEVAKLNASEIMRAGPYGEYVTIVTQDDTTRMSLRQFEPEKTIYEGWIKQNASLIPLVQEYEPQYQGLYNDCCAEGGKLAGQLRMLQPGDNSIVFYTSLLKQIGTQAEAMPLFADRFERESALLSKNLSVLQNGYSGRVGAAKNYASSYATEAGNVINAFHFYLKKDEEAVQETKALNEKYGILGGPDNVRQKVKEMLEQGKIAEVPAYLQGLRRGLQELYKKTAVLPQLKQLHLNTYLDVAERMPASNPQAHADMTELARDLPAEGVVDEAFKLSGQYAELSTQDINKLRGSYVTDEWVSVMLEDVDKFLTFLPRLSAYDQELRALYAGENYDRAVQRQKEIMNEVAGAGDVAGPWIKTTKAGPAPINFLFLSADTKNTMQQAVTRLQGKQRQTALAAYRIVDPRLNTHSVDNVSGLIAVTNDDIIYGGLLLTGRLSDMSGINKILFSENGGRTWEEIPISQNLSIAISPTPGMTYQPLLRIKNDFQETVDLPFFPNVTGIVFKTIDYTVLAQEVVTKIAEAYEKQDTSAFAALIARDYLGNRVFLEEGVRFDFDMFANIQLKIFIDRIEKRGNQYVADTHWEKSQTPRKTGQQQMTTGKTVMIFVMEEGKLKIQNLRGNLLYATLKPEIAQASGLSQAIVEQIRIAEFERNPVQPGAGQTVNSGGVGSGVTLPTRTAFMVDGDSFLFRQGTIVPNPGGDIGYSAGTVTRNTSGTQLSSVDFSVLTTAPTSGYVTGGGFTAVIGSTYVIQTGDGYYCKIKITGDTGGEISFQYAIGTTAGSTDLTT